MLANFPSSNENITRNRCKKQTELQNDIAINLNSRRHQMDGMRMGKITVMVLNTYINDAIGNCRLQKINGVDRR